MKCAICKKTIKKGEHKSIWYVPVGSGFIAEYIHSRKCDVLK